MACAADGTAVVLLYHRVAEPPSDVYGLAVAPGDFRAHMAHLRERYHPMPLADLAAAARAGSLPAGAVAVTFDDGYLDNYTTASPILSAFDVPATFFVTTHTASDREEYWWDTLERVLVSARGHLPSELRIGLPDAVHNFSTGTARQRLDALWSIHRGILTAGPAVSNRVALDLLRWACIEQPVAIHNRRMRLEEVAELSTRRGHIIGAHAVNHPMLPCQPSTLQRVEIQESRRTLEQLLGCDIFAFAYPFGAHDDDTVACVRECGFEMAVTCEETGVTPNSNLFRLPRFLVTAERALNFDGWMSKISRRERRTAAGTMDQPPPVLPV